MLDVNQLKQDMASLKLQVNADQAAVAAVQAFVGAQAKQIADLTTQLAAAQAANPDVDLSDLEASIAELVATNQVLGSIAPGAPANPITSTGANPGLTSTGAPTPGTPAADASGTAAQTADASGTAASTTDDSATTANEAPAAPQTAQS